MNGASAVYAVTNYWEKMDQELEIQQGKNIVDAAKDAGVQHFIWSSLYNVNKRKYSVFAGHLMRTESVFMKHCLTPHSLQWQASPRLSLR